jgi:hypothetical protein
MAKPLRVAGEVDSWCTKCRLVLNHRIVSMKVGKPYQVECLTCRTTHLWRATAPGEKAPSTTTSGAGRPRAASGPKSTRITPAMKQEQAWEKAIAGHGVHEFKTYNTTLTFQEGQLLRHKKFGDGVVMRVIDAHKVEVLFRDEPKTLAMGMS